MEMLQPFLTFETRVLNILLISLKEGTNKSPVSIHNLSTYESKTGNVCIYIIVETMLILAKYFTFA